MKKSHLIIAVLFVLMILWNWNAGAVQLDERGCHNLSLISLEVVWAKEVGADKDKVRVSLIAIADTDKSGVMGLILRGFEDLWNTAANWRQVGQWVMDDCYARRGVYPDQI